MIRRRNIVKTDYFMKEENLKGFSDSLDLFRWLIEQIPVATYITPLNFHAGSLYNSPQIEQIVGYTAQEWTDDPSLWQKHLHLEDRQRVIRALEQTYQTHESFDCQYRLYNRQGKIVWVRDRAVVVHDPQGVPGFLQGVVYDITREKQAEQELIEARDDLERLVTERTQALHASEERYRTLAEASRQKQAESPLEERAKELFRANALLSTLSVVTTRLKTTDTPDQLMEIIGSELKLLGLTIQIILSEKETNRLVIAYSNIEPKALKQAEIITGFPIIGYQIPKEGTILGKMILENKPSLVEEPLPILLNTFPNVVEDDIRKTLPSMGLKPDAPALLLPMKIKDQVMGAIVVWGDDIKEDDLTAFALFSSHVTVALDNVRLYDEIQQLALLDDLTGLYNRRGFFALTEQQLRLAKRKKKNLLLIYMDVDDFKNINDTYGHAEGDKALGEIAQLLKQSFRASDIVARMSGDEFAILAIETTPEDAAALLERLQLNLERFNQSESLKYKIAISEGISLWSPESPMTIDELLSQADAAMYQHKRTKLT